jgi:hypothetical protein
VRLALLLVLVFASTARADVKIDWARGLVIADAVGVADRHAPNPAVARGTSKRGAEQAAQRQIAAKLGDLPLATGGKVADKAKDKDVQARLDRAVASAITLSADPETDGAWKVTLALPIEAVRLAIAGPRALGPDGDKGSTVIVVEGVTAKPAVGWKIDGIDAPTLWVTEVPAWAKDAHRAKAKSAKAGVIEVAGIDATAATLFVIVTK